MKKIGFIGGVEVSWYCLEAICVYGIKPVIVFSYDESLKHRSGYKSFDDLALKYGFEIVKTRDINSEENIQILKEKSLDVLFVIGWSQLVKKEILDITSMGCIGVHPTKLPEGRGRAPIPWTLIKGLEKSAVTIFFLDEGADSGNIILQKDLYISIHDDAKSLYKKVLDIHIELINEVLLKILNDNVKSQPQDNTQATYWKKRKPEDGIIEWSKKTIELYNWIRALTHPYPGAFTFYNGKRIYIWKAEAVNVSRDNLEKEPGKIIGKVIGTCEDNSGIIVATTDGFLILRVVQFESENEINPVNLIETGRLKVGEKFK